MIWVCTRSRLVIVVIGLGYGFYSLDEHWSRVISHNGDLSMWVRRHTWLLSVPCRRHKRRNIFHFNWCFNCKSFNRGLICDSVLEKLQRSVKRKSYLMEIKFGHVFSPFEVKTLFHLYWKLPFTVEIPGPSPIPLISSRLHHNTAQHSTPPPFPTYLPLLLLLLHSVRLP